MKKLFIYLLVIPIFVSCEKNKSEFTVRAKVLRTFDSTFFDGSKYRINTIDLSIKNISKESISFWMMNCSWTDNWVLNTDNYYFLSIGCDKNYPVKVNIKPNDSVVYHSLITRQNIRFIDTDTIRFGLIYIDTIKCKTYIDYIKVLGDRSKQDKINWSNPLSLKDK
jgi:hypothetical protein